MADPRVTAIGNIAAVLDGRSLDDVLAGMPPAIDERDRAFVAELSFGVCRWYRRLDALVGQLLKKPFKRKDRDLHLLLMLGAYQLLYSRVPPHAAVSTTVDVSRQLGKGWASKLVNGVMRRLQREQSALQQAVDADPATRHAQPDWLYRAIADAWPDQVDPLMDALQQRAPMVLRVDLRRTDRAEYVHELGAAGIAAKSHAGVASAVVLDVPVGVDRLPGFADGEVSVQDAGAQLAAPFLDLEPGQRVLDACAAPGGKTLHIAQHQPEVRLTAIDIDAHRLQRVGQNLQRAGMQAQLSVGDAAQPQAADWGGVVYDRILVDAPCSATGVMRRHPDIRLLRRAEDIPALVRRQSDILDAMWSVLAPGGRLLYATCSLLPAENHEQVAAFLARTPNAKACELPTNPGTCAGDGVQLLPNRDDTDGFFYAALVKAPHST